MTEQPLSEEAIEIEQQWKTKVNERLIELTELRELKF